jgi:hypothetical protein
VASKQQEKPAKPQQAPALNRYAAHLFYSAGPEKPTRSRDAFSVTYSNGHARPVTALLPADRTPTSVVAGQRSANASNPRNQNSGQDQMALTREAVEARNGSSSWRAPASPSPAHRVSRREQATGPVYSDDFRRTLEALLGG